MKQKPYQQTTGPNRGERRMRDRFAANKGSLLAKDPTLNADGPRRKFHLVKQFGERLRAAGIDPTPLSCAELETEIVKLIRADFVREITPKA